MRKSYNSIAEVWAAAIGAGTALYGAYNSYQSTQGGGGGSAPQRNPYLETNQQMGLSNQQIGNYNNNFASSLLGSFDQGAFFNANPEAFRQYNEAIANGGLQGWTPQQFAQAYIGSNDPSVGSTTNGSGPLNSYRSGGLLQTIGQVQPLLTQINQAQNPNIAALQKQLTAQAQGGMPGSGNLGTLTGLVNQGFGGGYAAGNYQAQQFDPSGLMANTNFSAQQVQAQQGNPLLSQLNQQAMANQGPSGLQQQQNVIAQQLLANGGNLSASDLRNVQQASRQGFASRGLGATNASVSDEVMQTDAAQRARLTQNLGLAQGVQNQGLAEQNQQQQFGLGVGAQNYNYAGLDLSGQQSNQSANLQAQNMGLNAQIANQNFGLGSFNANSNSAFNAAQLNNQSQQFQSQQQLQAQLAQAQYAAQAAGLDQSQNQQNLQAQQLALQGNLATYNPISMQDIFGLGSNAANQNNSYWNDLYNTNFNSSASQNINNQNNNAAFNNGLMNFGGGVLNSYLKGQGQSPGTGGSSPGWWNYLGGNSVHAYE